MEVKVLLTNDDGFYAEGLQTLFHSLNQLAEVTVVAPDRERSAVGHGITMNQPLRVTPVTLEQSTHSHWLVDGTPADCVKIALDILLKKNPPNLIISGLNHGANLGSDVLYSGTVSAALEASMYHLPSIAASLVGHGKMDFKPAADFLANNLQALCLAAQNTVLNINFPELDHSSNYTGVKYTRLGQRLYENVFEERRDPRGRIYYWMGGEAINCEQQPDSDIAAIENDYISITPLQSDMTNNADLTKLSTATDALKVFKVSLNVT